MSKLSTSIQNFKNKKAGLPPAAKSQPSRRNYNNQPNAKMQEMQLLIDGLLQENEQQAQLIVELKAALVQLYKQVNS